MIIVGYLFYQMCNEWNQQIRKEKESELSNVQNVLNWNANIAKVIMQL